MIRNKRMFGLSIILLLICLILVFPFPHRYELGNVIFSFLNIPTRLANGFLSVGITATVIFIISLYLFLNALNKYHIRLFILVILLIGFIPSTLINMYQTYFAKDIYALSYVSEESECNFDMVGEETLLGKCDLSFENKSNRPIQFTVEFQEELLFKDDLPFVALMNQDDPYDVKLDAKETKRIKFSTHIDVSKMAEHIESGVATGIDIKVQAKDKFREL